MRSKKQTIIENYFIIIVAGILLVIVAFIVFATLQASTPQPPQPIQPTTTPSPTPTPINTVDAPPVSYDSDATDKLIEKVRNHPTLSQTDISAKQKILSLLPKDKTSGYVYASSTVRIEYLKTPDVFLVEILTTDLSQAKADANIWLRTQGLSQAGICNLPVSFYVNWEISQQLRKSNIKFNPLPNSC